VNMYTFYVVHKPSQSNVHDAGLPALVLCT